MKADNADLPEKSQLELLKKNNIPSVLLSTALGRSRLTTQFRRTKRGTIFSYAS
jgi:hypothetical protein